MERTRVGRVCILPVRYRALGHKTQAASGSLVLGKKPNSKDLQLLQKATNRVSRQPGGKYRRHGVRSKRV